MNRKVEPAYLPVSGTVHYKNTWQLRKTEELFTNHSQLAGVESSSSLMSGSTSVQLKM